MRLFHGGVHRTVILEEDMISDKVKAYCKNIEEWPDIWKYDQPDVAVGKIILHSAYIPFIDFLISKKLAQKQKQQ